MEKCSVTGCSLPVKAKGMCNKHFLRVRNHGSPDENDRTHAPPEVRFWRGVKRGGIDDCWIYFRKPGQKRYAQFQPGGKGSKSISVHRYSYEIHKGKIPDGLVVMHSCDNPRCVNPSHLSVGTFKENTEDMIAKGRQVIQFGEQSSFSKLTEEQARAIKYGPKERRDVISERYGISKQQVTRIKKGQSWPHI